MATKNTKALMVRLAEDQHEKLRRLSFESRLSISEIVRRLVERVTLEDLIRPK